MKHFINTFVAGLAFIVLAISAFAQSTVVPIDNEPAPKLTVTQPLPGPWLGASFTFHTASKTCASCRSAGKSQARCLRGSGIFTSR
jgi:hypothetical protein